MMYRIFDYCNKAVFATDNFQDALKIARSHASNRHAATIVRVGGYGAKYQVEADGTVYQEAVVCACDVCHKGASCNGKSTCSRYWELEVWEEM